MTQCKNCKGKGTYRAFVRSEYGGCAWRDVGCYVCGGSGEITEEQVVVIAEGERRRLDRIARGVSMRDEARSLGMDVVALSDLEHGRIPKEAQL